MKNALDKLSSARSALYGLLVVGSVLFAFSSSAHATLLVYEGFDYDTGGSFKAMNTFNPGAGTGLDTGSSYYQSSGGGINPSDTLMTMGSLPTTGYQMGMHDYTGLVGAKVSSATPSVSGDLFVSFLFKGVGLNQSDDWAILSANKTSPSGAYTDRYFNINPVSRVDGSHKIAISYGNTYLSPTQASQSLADNTDYFFVAQFTNVGAALSVGNPGVATLWVLTAAQYDYFAEHGFSSAALNSASIGSGAANVYSRVSDTATSGTYKFDNTVSLQYILQSKNGGGMKFDELRIGTTLNDVVAIPEPSAAGFIGGVTGLSIATLLIRRSHR